MFIAGAGEIVEAVLAFLAKWVLPEKTVSVKDMRNKKATKGWVRSKNVLFNEWPTSHNFLTESILTNQLKQLSVFK